jgi:uncharacterized protein
VSPPSAGAAARKRCTVAYATRERQYLWSVELPLAASIAEALAAARTSAAEEAGGAHAAVPWDSAAVGIFGEPRSRSDSCADGDRIELYRPLQRDPREQRRARVKRERRGRRTRAG